MQLVHCSTVVSINCRLLFAFAVGHGKRGANFGFSRVRDGPKQCPNDSGSSLLPKIMIKDREKGDRTDGGRNLSPENRNLIDAV